MPCSGHASRPDERPSERRASGWAPSPPAGGGAGVGASEPRSAIPTGGSAARLAGVRDMPGGFRGDGSGARAPRTSRPPAGTLRCGRWGRQPLAYWRERTDTHDSRELQGRGSHLMAASGVSLEVPRGVNSEAGKRGLVGKGLLAEPPRVQGRGQTRSQKGSCIIHNKTAKCGKKLTQNLPWPTRAQPIFAHCWLIFCTSESQIKSSTVQPLFGRPGDQ